jgi:phosphate acyltransferase
MKIALDAMGGDKAPRVTVAAAAAISLENKSWEIVLVGDQPVIQQELKKHSYHAAGISIVHTDVNISMDEAPTVVLRQKRNSSIALAMNLHKEGRVQGVVSAGNTGAVMASAIIELGRIKDVNRPALAVLPPTSKGPCVLLDAGANASCKSINLLEFAHMGSIYAEYILNIKKPTVGLLSIGEENTKGNEMTIEANQLLSQSKLNFVGNIEGDDIMKHTVDVVVCDGFVGNVILKFLESILHMLKEFVGTNIKTKLRYQMGGLLLKPLARKFTKDFNYEEYGGAPLLGVNGSVIKSHGSSSVEAIKSALRVAGKMAEANLTQIIEKRLETK